MVILGGWVFLMSEAPLYMQCIGTDRVTPEGQTRAQSAGWGVLSNPHPGNLQKDYA